MSWNWCQWYSRTGRMVRHKQSGKTAEVVYVHSNGDYEVQLDSGTCVAWFRENVEAIEHEEKVK